MRSRQEQPTRPRTIGEKRLGSRNSLCECCPSGSFEGPLLLEDVVPEERRIKTFERCKQGLSLAPSIDKDTDDVSSRARKEHLASRSQLAQAGEQSRTTLTLPWKDHERFVEQDRKSRFVNEQPRPGRLPSTGRRSVEAVAPDGYTEPVGQPLVSALSVGCHSGQPAGDVRRNSGIARLLRDCSDRRTWHGDGL